MHSTSAAIGDDIRTLGLTGEARKLHRLIHSKSHVEAFFAWVDHCLQEHGLRSTTLFTKALNYVRERRLGLEVFLTDPDIPPLDTNHLERSFPRRSPSALSVTKRRYGSVAVLIRTD